MKLQYSKEADLQKIFRLIVIISFSTLISLGMLRSWRLDISDQVENLKWLSSSIIQAYAAALVLIITLGVVLLSLFAEKYSPKLIRKLWKSRKMNFYFLCLMVPIAICCTILVSLSEDSSFSLDILGNSIPMVKFFVALEMLTISIFILTAYLILEDIYEAVGGQMDEVLSGLIRDVQTQDNTEEAFLDLFRVLSSLAEKRDLIGLKKTIEKLFDLIIGNEKHCEIVFDMLYDVYTKYENKNEYFCLIIMRKTIEKSHEKVSKSNNNSLIRKFSNFVTKIQNVKRCEPNQESTVCN